MNTSQSEASENQIETEVSSFEPHDNTAIDLSADVGFSPDNQTYTIQESGNYVIGDQPPKQFQAGAVVVNPDTKTITTLPKLSLNETEHINNSKAYEFAVKHVHQIQAWREQFGDNKPLPIIVTPEGDIIWLNRKMRRSI